jgi:ABC-type Fe3+-citrate transport system substrate-binding protein
MEITKKIYSEISAGELLDKISILEIKKNKIKDKTKRNIVLKELRSLQETFKENIEKSKSLTKLYKKLKSVNVKLWKIEDDIRDFEKKRNFEDKFIKLARAVYFTNDERSRVKNKINSLTKSNISEVKSYKKY